MDNGSLLIVDDVELNRAILAEMFSHHFQILEAENGQEALEIIEMHRESIKIVLLDILMPIMDGFEMLEEMQRRHIQPSFPIVMISAETSEDSVLRGYELGVSDFISRPFNSCIVKSRVRNIIDLFQHRHQLEELVEKQTRKLKQANLFIIDTLSTVVEFRNGESGSHTRRVRYLTKLLLQELMKRYPEYGLKDSQIEEMSNAAALHDLGKICIPENILNKPGKLTYEEFELMKTHTIRGAEILKTIHHVHDEKYMEYCYNICRYHHERWDGKGYPDGLHGHEIPLCAQVVSIADVYDALVSTRVYKGPYKHDVALRMILNGECGNFNPQLLECLVVYENDIEEKLSQLSLEDDQQGMHVEETQQLAYDDNHYERMMHLVELEREKYFMLASLSGEILFDYDSRHDSIKFSDKFKEVFDDDIYIQNFITKIKNNQLVFLQNSSQNVLEIIKDLSNDRPFINEKIKLYTKKQTREWFELNIKTIWDHNNPTENIGCVGSILNVNKEVNHTNLLEKRANYDDLTKLHNRRYIQQKISELNLLPEYSSALIFLDIDHFKNINDTYGHIFGDDVLRNVADTIYNIFDDSSLCGRYGGDEFMIYVWNIASRLDLEQSIQKLFHKFKNHQIIHDTQVSITISAGITWAHDEKSYEQLLSEADTALYAAKAKGRKCFVFYEDVENEDKRF